MWLIGEYCTRSSWTVTSRPEPWLVEVEPARADPERDPSAPTAVGRGVYPAVGQRPSQRPSDRIDRCDGLPGRRWYGNFKDGQTKRSHMKIRQTARHWAYKTALTAPVVGSVVRGKLVDLHTSVFLEKADEGHREARREHLDALFDATIDVYLDALSVGYSEAEAREITHVQGNFDFYNHGWTEMMEFPADELEPHYERYRSFFEPRGITIDEPLGEYAPDGGLPSAPSTPERLDEPEHPHAEGGFADDVYVETEDGELVVGGRDEPTDVDVSDAPSVEKHT